MSDLDARVTETLRRSAEAAAVRAHVPDPASVRSRGTVRRRRARLAGSSAVAIVLAVAIALPLALVSLQGSGTVPSTTRNTGPTVTTPKASPVRGPVVDLGATPPGWVPVTYRGAQIAVPPTWRIGWDTVCDLPARPAVVYVGRTGYGFCPLYQLRGATEVLLQPYSRPGASGNWHPLRVNGIRVLALRGGPDFATFEVRSLGVQLTLEGARAQRVLHTLTYSPRAVALAAGAVSPPPSSWRTVRFAGLRVSVPGSWPVAHSSDALGPDDNPCGDLNGDYAQGAMLGSAGKVVLSTDEFDVSFNCPLIPSGPGRVVAAPEGLLVNRGPRDPTVVMTGRLCRSEHGLRICVQDTGSLQFGVLELGVTRSGGGTLPGSAWYGPAVVSIGLAGNGHVARSILDSLRLAPGPD